MELPRHILDRVERVYAYHRASKLAFNGCAPLQPAGRPISSHRTFPQHPRIKLPTSLLDAPLDTLAVMESSLEALPDSFLSPPQTLKTLASWLYMADGILTQDNAHHGNGNGHSTANERRTCPSAADTCPFEIYVVSIGLEDLDPGLYHYNPREFSLRKLREGHEALSQLKRGRPDLEFVKSAPAALLVSTVYCRASAVTGLRGYRASLVDAGHLTQNLVTTAGGLGIQTITRLRMTESTMRELIGLPPRDGASPCDYGQEESIQAMIVWADRAQREAILTHAPAASARETLRAPSEPRIEPEQEAEPEPPLQARAHDHQRAATAAVTINAGAVSVASFNVPDLLLPTIGRKSLPEIHRAAPAPEVKPYGSILAVHQDCVAPGIAIREIRPPLTELSPVPAHYPAAAVAPSAAHHHHNHAVPLRDVLLNATDATDFYRDAIPRDSFRTINRLAFRGGSYFPLFPAGVHVALVRPFWVVHNVSGMESGVWCYRADRDDWCFLLPQESRLEAQYLTCEDQAFGNAAAVCFMVANAFVLLSQGGPDTYRLAHLEAGTVAQRLVLAARGLRLAAKPSSFFYDDELRKFLGLEQTGWEPIHAVAVGTAGG
jgi:SagB-type dehydrogenase family enzyme